MSGPLLVLNVAGLSPRLVGQANRCPNLTRLVSEAFYAPLQPVFPAVTCTAQASLTTGAYPSEHGIVANGLYFRERFHTSFWEQSDRLVQAERIWTRLKAEHGTRTAVLFFQNSLYADVDAMLTPWPLHAPDGETVQACYSVPTSLNAELRAELGEFPLHHFWGPMAGRPSTEWIVAAARHCLDTQTPDLTFCYIPHLDYVLQKDGPNSGAALDELEWLDGKIEELRTFVQDKGGNLMVVSEYGLTEVDGDIALNREFRKAGFLEVREVEGREYLDFGASRAFAMVDHQVAHIYVQDPRDNVEVETLLGRIRGIDKVLPRCAFDDLNINHARSGDLIAISNADKWFSYYWWEEDNKAPLFAPTVDIHSKPGYDPLEMFVDPETRAIDICHTEKIKGSHGRLPDDPKDGGVILCTAVPKSLPSDGVFQSVDVVKAIEEVLLG